MCAGERNPRTCPPHSQRITVMTEWADEYPDVAPLVDQGGAGAAGRGRGRLRPARGCPRIRADRAAFLQRSRTALGRGGDRAADSRRGSRPRRRRRARRLVHRSAIGRTLRPRASLVHAGPVGEGHRRAGLPAQVDAGRVVSNRDPQHRRLVSPEPPEILRRTVRRATGRRPARTGRRRHQAGRRAGQGVLHDVAEQYRRGFPGRSDVWRQLPVCRLETGRLPRPTLQLRRRDRAVRQTVYAADGGHPRPRRQLAAGRLSMATRLKPVDVVLVGFGWTASIMAQQLTDAGMQVLALERGKFRDTVPDFATTQIQDELRYAVRDGLFQEPARDTLTFRNSMDQTALPMRHLGSFLPGVGVGGAGVHWNGQTWRFLPEDFVIRSHTEQRYGKSFTPPDMTIQDWGITYAELEPHYDAFDYLCGVSGQAGNIQGQLQIGGNPFEGPRQRGYPLAPLKRSHA